jgi:hypothetical protein
VLGRVRGLEVGAVKASLVARQRVAAVRKRGDDFMVVQVVEK